MIDTIFGQTKQIGKSRSQTTAQVGRILCGKVGGGILLRAKVNGPLLRGKVGGVSLTLQLAAEGRGGEAPDPDAESDGGASN